MSATLVAGPFLIPHYLLLFGASSSKVSCYLSVLVFLEELTLGFSPFTTSSSHIFKLSFWLPFPLLFFLSKLISSYQVESCLAISLHGSSFWVPWGTRPLFINCWFPSFLIPFCIDRDISVIVPCVFWHPLWTVLIQPWLCCTFRGSQAPSSH